MFKTRIALATGVTTAVLLVGFSAHVIATSVTGQPAAATVIAPIVVTPVGLGLNFGSVSNSTAGTVTVDLDPTLALNPASSGDGGEVLSGSGAARAQFDLTGNGTASYNVDFTSNTFPIDLSGDGTVTLAGLTWAGNGGTTLGTGAFTAGTDTMYVGGTLSLTTAPTAGLHTGSYSMDVVYN